MKPIQFILLTFLLLGSACGSSRITSSWKAEEPISNEYQKILVIGLIHEADRSVQEQMEDHLVNDLKALGYSAISSLKEYGPKAFNKMDEEEAIQKIKNNDVDAVITIVLLDKEKERKYVPERILYSPYGYYYNHFWGYRTALFHRIYQPGYYVNNTKYFWESNLYDMKTQKLVYSVQTQSFDPANSAALGHEYGQMIVNNMVKQKVLKDKERYPSKKAA